MVLTCSNTSGLSQLRLHAVLRGNECTERCQRPCSTIRHAYRRPDRHARPQLETKMWLARIALQDMPCIQFIFPNFTP
jgi:hypothetical protein